MFSDNFRRALQLWGECFIGKPVFCRIIVLTALIICGHCFTSPISRVNKYNSLREHEGDFEIQREFDPNNDYELQLGRVLDALKTDYPNILVDDPDYSIYSDTILAKDPSGFSVNGLNNYKQAFALVHTVVNVFYCPDQSLLTFKMIHDRCHDNIRISWNADVVPKQIFGSTKNTLHVNGISVYELNMKGKVQRHHIQNLLINNQPMVTHNIMDALRAELSDTECVPVFTQVVEETMSFKADAPSKSNTVHFTPQNLFRPSESLFSSGEKITRSSLAALSAAPPPGHDNSKDSKYPDLDWDAFEQKNKSRKKFGLKPLSPEEYIKLESEVKKLESKQLAKYPSSTGATQMPLKKKSPMKGMLTKMFGDVFEDTCESNWDCERPEVCCDFKVKKICCSSGQMMQVQEIKVPVRASYDDDEYYRGGR